MKIYRITIKTITNENKTVNKEKFYKTSYLEFFKKLLYYRKIYGQENVSGSYSKVTWR